MAKMEYMPFSKSQICNNIEATEASERLLCEMLHIADKIAV